MPVAPVIRAHAALLAVRRIDDSARTHSITKLLLGSLAWRKVIRHECYPLSVSAWFSNRPAASACGVVCAATAPGPHPDRVETEADIDAGVGV